MVSKGPNSDVGAEARAEAKVDSEGRQRFLVAWLKEHPDEADPTRPGAVDSFSERPQIVRRGRRLAATD